MKTQARILLLDWQESHYYLLEKLLCLLETAQFDLNWCKEAISRADLVTYPCDVYVIHVHWLSESGREDLLMENLTTLVCQVHPKPIIVLTDERELGLKAIAAGAADFWEVGQLTESVVERSLRLTLSQARTHTHYQSLLSDGKARKGKFVNIKSSSSRQVLALNSERHTAIQSTLPCRGANLVGSRRYSKKAFSTLSLLEIISRYVNEAQESEARFRAVVEQAAIGIALVAPNGQFFQVNQKLCQILGYTDSELLSLTCQDISHPEDLPTTREDELRERLLQGTISHYSIEKRYMCQDRHWRWMEVTVSAIKDIKGLPQAVIVIVEDIQEHKQAIEALQQREQEFKALVENCPDAILRVDRELHYCYVNPTVLGFAGQPLEAFIGKKVQEMGHPEEVVSLWVTTVQRVIESGREQTIEYSFPSPGQIAYWSSRVVPERNAQGEVETVLVVSHNITERKQAEEQYASIFDHSAEAICLMQVQADGRFVYETVNPAYGQATGISAVTFAGKTPSEVFPLTIARLMEGWFKTCVKVQKTLSYEEVLEFSTGVRTWRTNLVPIVNGEDKIIKLQGSSRDITEEKKILEQQMRYSRHQRLLGVLGLKFRQSWQITDIWQTVVIEIREALQVDRVLIMKLDDRETASAIDEAVAPPFVSLLNREIKINAFQEQWQPRYLDDYIDICPDVALANCNPFCWELLKTYQIRAHAVAPILQPRQEKSNPSLWGFLWLHQCSQPRQWTEEEIDLLRQLSNQLTIALERVYLRQQEIVRTQELTRSNRELELFAQIVSHDLQSPLGTITSYAQLLQNRYRGKLDEKADKYLQHLISGTRRMRQQIEDLLEYSRITTRKQPFQLTDCNEIIDLAIESLQFAIEKNHAIIKIPTALPIVTTDPSQLVQLFQNLLGNALKYRSECSPVIEIEVRRQGDGWLFSICDNGIGIEPKYSERIFQIFQRLHTQEEYPGTGMGLAICQRIVQRHGGSIWVKSQLGQGSTFYFTISASLTLLENGG